MKPPDLAVPSLPTVCMRCGDPFADTFPAALLRCHNTRPGHPDWSWQWVCDECADDQFGVMK